MHRIISVTKGQVAGAKPMRGLGDAVAVVADPIARVLRIDPQKCGCKKRQERLNQLVPFVSADRIQEP